ncbi:hypothetical protein LX64_04619 [Chitinophaga skermanii]|uniref:Uncharacterized protein n=1 Tax=Chitinophaga skermanii TaxID=331697 RepID=A0A327Q2E3_9BACT|nr:hypothetical protein [Chitinophaga skermanii]RAI98635.1 hypothetical protein LX64_04619 [Chitinophaga skermanii]
MKKLISIILFSLICVQLLPIKEVGKLIFNNQIVEEHVEGGCSAKSPMKLVKDVHFCNSEQSSFLDPGFIIETRALQYFEQLPASPIKEIQTPPPNFTVAA